MSSNKKAILVHVTPDEKEMLKRAAERDRRSLASYLVVCGIHVAKDDLKEVYGVVEAEQGDEDDGER